MHKAAKFRTAAMSVVAIAALGAGYTAATTSQSSAAASAAPGDVYKATATVTIGESATHVVALSLPAGTYTVTATTRLIYADKARCWFTGNSFKAETPQASGFDQSSLSFTGVVTLTKEDKVQLFCESETVLPAPQWPGAFGTLVATRAGLYQDQGTGVS